MLPLPALFSPELVAVECLHRKSRRTGPQGSESPVRRLLLFPQLGAGLKLGPPLEEYQRLLILPDGHGGFGDIYSLTEPLSEVLTFGAWRGAHVALLYFLSRNV